MGPEQKEKLLSEHVLAQQAQIIYRQLVALPVIGLFATLLIVSLVWARIEHSYIYTWIALSIFTYWIATPYAIYKSKTQPPSKRYTKRIRIHACVRSVFEGITWGSSAFLLFDQHSNYYQAILLAFVIGVAAIGALLNAAYRPTFYILSFVMLVPFIGVFFVAPGLINSIIALCILFYLILLSYHTNINYNSIRASLELQFKLHEQKELAEGAKKTQTQFFAAANHDLRQPLHAHGLLVSVLKKHIKDAEGLAILTLMSDTMEGMRSLLNSFLDVSRLDAGALYPNIKAFALSPLLNRLFLEFESHATKKGVSLAMRSMEVKVLSDQLFVERILRNLLDNAIIHAAQGSVLLAARYRKHGKIRLEVRDSGPGIDAENHDLVFQDYKQLDGRQGKSNAGMGLGLAIVRRLADLLNIPVELKSEPGKGAVFAIELPVTYEQSVDYVDAVSAEESLSLVNKTLMVIDDNTTILSAMRFIISDWGCNVLTAQSGDSAMQQLSNTSSLPDALIVDYRLAGESGIDLVEKLNTHLNSSIPAIIITGDTALDKIIEIQQSHCDVLHKPVSPEQLQQKIVALVKHA